MDKNNKKVLVIGSGGREHALTKKLSESLFISKVYCLPGNGGTEIMKGKVENITNINDLNEIVNFAKNINIDLVCIGPEQPLVDGLCDLMLSNNIPCVGPSQLASTLEASKAWSKDFMKRNNIPTARFSNFQYLEEALHYLESIDYDIVIKASGLAAGKGVILPTSKEEAKEVIIDIMKNNRFGSAGKEIVIEERLIGEEVSILAFCDGKNAVCMPAAQDHKRVFDNDQGPNTGGMGAYAPARVFTTSPPSLKQQCWDIVQKTVTCLAEEGRPYHGILYAGFMLTSNGPMVLEYNCRFGDPETQVLLPLLESDLYDILLACVQGNLNSSLVKWHEDLFATTVICASGGYPDNYNKGYVINGLEKIKNDNVIIYHSGTKIQSSEEGSNHQIVTNGGRVLAVTGIGKTLRSAVNNSYETINQISFEGIQYRRDIAHRALNAPLRIGVLGSTRGTDMQAIIDAIQSKLLTNVVISVCISNKKESGILERARQHNIPAIHIGAAGLSREQHDEKVTNTLHEYGVELVLLIGYMRIVSSEFTNHWKWRVINVHPSLLPEFAGGMDCDVHSAVLAANRTKTGCTIHFLTEVVDGGPIILQKECHVDPSVDTPNDLKTRVQLLEGQAFIEVIEKFRDDEIGPQYKNGLPNPNAITYKVAGVDIDAGEALVDRIKPFCKSTRRLGCNADLGGFGALFDLQQAGLSGNSDTVLVSGADGVGTKLLVAQSFGKHDTVGIDLVAMNANDIVVCGAQPLFFLDYYACGKLNVDVAAQVVSGIAEGCRQSGAALIGGETAEMAGMYSNDEYDLAGFCVGAVSRSKVLPNYSSMRPEGDILIGLRSSGLHSNGYSLVRKCVKKSGLSWNDPAPFQPELTLGEALLCPTKIYVKSILALTSLSLVKGLAHITGGGFPENIPRMLPEDILAVVDINWSLPPVFKWIQEIGDISKYEMMRTLNCGVGMVLLIAGEDKDQVLEILKNNGEVDPIILGFTTRRPHLDFHQVLIRGELN